MNTDALLTAMVDDPTLIRRPLVIADDRFVIGYDREALDSLAGAREERGK